MEQQITATLLDENNNEFEQTFTVERKFTVANKDYLALIPLGDEDNVYLFDFEKQDGTITLKEIESDEEYDRVADAYEALMEE